MENQKKLGQTKKQGHSSARSNRNLIERNRRILMKNLLAKLFALIPTTQKSKVSVPELLDHATAYTKQLQERIEKIRERKELLKGHRSFEPVINIKSSDSTLEVTIMCGLEKNFLLHQVIRVMEQEGADVVSTTYHNAGDRILYTIYSKAVSTRIGIETSRVDKRLKKLITETQFLL